eukprot:1219467-Rhodomonas_salina.2
MQLSDPLPVAPRARPPASGHPRATPELCNVRYHDSPRLSAHASHSPSPAPPPSRLAPPRHRT